MLNRGHGKRMNAEVVSLNTSQVRGTLLLSGRLRFDNETGKTAPLTLQGYFDGSGLLSIQCDILDVCRTEFRYV